MPSALFVAQRVDGAGRLVEGTLQSMLRRFSTDRNVGRSLEIKRDEGLAKCGRKILRQLADVPTFQKDVRGHGLKQVLSGANDERCIVDPFLSPSHVRRQRIGEICSRKSIQRSWSQVSIRGQNKPLRCHRISEAFDGFVAYVVV